MVLLFNSLVMTNIFPIKVRMNVLGNLYAQHIPKKPLKIGDLVFDTHDYTFGYVDFIHDIQRVAVTQGGCTEVGVEVKRLRLLLPLTKWQWLLWYNMYPIIILFFTFVLWMVLLFCMVNL